MAVIAAPELATAPDEPQSIAVIVGELMPAGALTFTASVIPALVISGDGPAPGDDPTVGYAG